LTNEDPTPRPSRASLLEGIRVWNVRAKPEKMKFDITKKINVEKEEKCLKEIMDLVERYGWRLEKERIPTLIDYVISVKTNLLSGTNRPYPEINKFKDKLASILQDYGLEIRAFDETISNDLKYRRIDVEIGIGIEKDRLR
jgi:hypothetical protein